MIHIPRQIILGTRKQILTGFQWYEVYCFLWLGSGSVFLSLPHPVALRTWLSFAVSGLVLYMSVLSTAFLLRAVFPTCHPNGVWALVTGCLASETEVMEILALVLFQWGCESMRKSRVLPTSILLSYLILRESRNCCRRLKFVGANFHNHL